MVREYRETHAAEILTQFAELLSIPNIHNDLPNIRKNADYLVEQFNLRGIKMELLKLPGAAPIIYGEINVPGATRTLGIYVHYDGQPSGTEEWVSGGPFMPKLYTARHDEGGQPVAFPETGATVDVGDDGGIIIGSPDGSAADKAIAMIEDLTKDIYKN